MPDLSLVLDEDLWDELCRRHDGCILVTVQRKTAQQEELHTNYHGGKIHCVGMAEYMKAVLLKELGEATHG